MNSQDPKALGAYLARPYSRILIPQEGGRFSAEILEFPGCFAEGETPEAAYANLEDAAASWLAACLAADTPVPPPLTNYEASGRFALRLPRSLYGRAAKTAAAEGTSLNQFIATAVAERIGALGVTEKLQAVVQALRAATLTLVSEISEANAPSAMVPGLSGTTLGELDGFASTEQAVH